jgi:hypothetical protein
LVQIERILNEHGREGKTCGDGDVMLERNEDLPYKIVAGGYSFSLGDTDLVFPKAHALAEKICYVSADLADRMADKYIARRPVIARLFGKRRATIETLLDMEARILWIHVVDRLAFSALNPRIRFLFVDALIDCLGFGKATESLALFNARHSKYSECNMVDGDLSHGETVYLAFCKKIIVDIMGFGFPSLIQFNRTTYDWFLESQFMLNMKQALDEVAKIKISEKT